MPARRHWPGLFSLAEPDDVRSILESAGLPGAPLVVRRS